MTLIAERKAERQRGEIEREISKDKDEEIKEGTQSRRLGNNTRQEEFRIKKIDLKNTTRPFSLCVRLMSLSDTCKYHYNYISSFITLSLTI